MTDTRAGVEQRSPAALYEAEHSAATEAGLRRFVRFADIETYVDRLVLGSWWSQEFPHAPLEVELTRRSRSATFSAATTEYGVGLVALVDGGGWGLETVLHELAHLAAGNSAGHGASFVDALCQLWRREAGFEAYVCLSAELRAAGLHGGCPRPVQHP